VARTRRRLIATHTPYGENIAVGYPTVSSVLQGRLGSEGHCRNVMNPAFTEIGAGYAIGPFGGNPAAHRLLVPCPTAARG